MTDEQIKLLFHKRYPRAPVVLHPDGSFTYMEVVNAFLLGWRACEAHLAAREERSLSNLLTESVDANDDLYEDKDNG